MISSSCELYMKMAQSEVRDSEAMKIQDHQFAKRAVRLKRQRLENTDISLHFKHPPMHT
jgi:hypothetical protein